MAATSADDIFLWRQGLTIRCERLIYYAGMQWADYYFSILFIGIRIAVSTVIVANTVINL
jgi:hypothetical protein